MKKILIWLAISIIAGVVFTILYWFGLPQEIENAGIVEFYSYHDMIMEDSLFLSIKNHETKMNAFFGAVIVSGLFVFYNVYCMIRMKFFKKKNNQPEPALH